MARRTHHHRARVTPAIPVVRVPGHRARHHKQHRPKVTPAIPVVPVHRHRQSHRKRKWTPGFDIDCCAAQAVAASLALTGASVSPQDVLTLYWYTADSENAGASLTETLGAISEHGLAGVKPVGFRPATELASGVILGTEVYGIPHAVTVDGHGMWTWGEYYPWLPDYEEAWTIEWH